MPKSPGRKTADLQDAIGSASRSGGVGESATQKPKAQVGRIMYIECKAGSLTGTSRVIEHENKERTHQERAASRRCCEPPQADGSMRFWRMHQLWELAEGLPVKKVRLNELEGFDEVRWFGGPRNILPTCRAIAEHARDIHACDLSYPILLSPTGEVLDGMHRICKAFLEGIAELDAVQLPTLPAYRWRVLVTGEEVEIVDDIKEQL